MSEDKKVVTLSDFEQRVLVKGMSEYRNDLLQEGKPTEDGDDVILKVIDATRNKAKRWGAREDR